MCINLEQIDFETLTSACNDANELRARLRGGEPCSRMPRIEQFQSEIALVYCQSKKALLCIVFCCILVFFSCATFAASTPEQAVRDAQRAIDAQSADRFEQLVDTKHILSAATDLLLAEANKPDGQLPPVLALMLSSVKDSQALAGLREFITQETRAFVRYGVLSGNFAGKPDQSVRPGGMLASLFGDVSMGRKELRVAGPSAPNGQEVLLPVELKDYGNDNMYPLLLRLQWHSPDWRIVEIANLSDIWNQIQTEAKAQR